MCCKFKYVKSGFPETEHEHVLGKVVEFDKFTKSHIILHLVVKVYLRIFFFAKMVSVWKK